MEQRKELSLPGYGFVSVYDEVTSTMDVARSRMSELLASHHEAGLVVARRQSAGRGRQGREWASEEGAFMGTFLFAVPQQVSAALLAGYSLAVGVGVAQALAGFGASVQLKWPNDIVVLRDAKIRKVGGVLIEVQEVAGERLLLVGLGLNLNAAPSSVPHALSLKELVSPKSELSVEKTLAALAQNLLQVHQDFLQHGGFRCFRDTWQGFSVFVEAKTPLTVEVAPGSVVSGVYSGVNETGALRLSVDGSERVIHSGHLL